MFDFLLLMGSDRKFIHARLLATAEFSFAHLSPSCSLNLPLSDEEEDGRDESDDADERAEVAGGGGLVEDADVLPLRAVVVPPVRRYCAEHEDGENLESLCLTGLLRFCAVLI